MQKYIKYSFFLSFVFFLTSLAAQEVKTCLGEGFANCGILEVSNKETVHLTFTSRVKYVDLGSSFFVFKLDSAVNIVKLKAKRFDPNETSNLTIITEDNYLYSFKIKIVNDVKVLTYLMQSSNVKMPDLPKKTPCYLVLNNPVEKKIFTKFSQGIRFSLLSTYYFNGKYIFTFSLKNRSKIPFEIESINLAITKVKSPVRQKIAYQETVLYAEDEKCNFKSLINPREDAIFSLIYPKFYPPDGYFISLQLNEKMDEYARSIRKRLNFKKIAKMKTLD